jgi:hypothetical protein
MAATKNPYYAEQLANWYAAGHKGQMPMITAAEQRAFNMASSPVGQNFIQRGTKLGLTAQQATSIPESQLIAMERALETTTKAQLETAQAAGRASGNFLQRVTKLNLPQSAATHLNETEILAAELDKAYRSQLQAYYAAEGTAQPIAKPTMTNERLLEIVSRNASPAAPQGTPGLGTDPYGTANPPWARIAQAIHSWANAPPQVGQLGSGVGNTGFTQAQLNAMGARALGTTGEIGTNIPFSQMGSSWYRGAGWQTGLGNAAVNMLPLIAYQIPMAAYSYMQANPNSRIAHYQRMAQQQGNYGAYELDPLKYSMNKATEGWTGAYDPNAGFLQNVGNVIYGGAKGLATGILSYPFQRVNQYVPPRWNQGTASTFGGAQNKTPGYLAGGALAYNLPFTWQQQGYTHPGAMFVNRYASGGRGIGGG